MSELKDLPKKKIQIGTNCQRLNIGKVYISSVLPSTSTSFNIGKINEAVKELCLKNNFVFIDHQSATINYLRLDGIHLVNSGKAILARSFTDH